MNLLEPLELAAGLRKVLSDIGPLAVATSGGVDSMTLAVAAHRLLPDVEILHAASAAVPPEATWRVRDWARREGWQLRVINAGEFGNENYRTNPVNRCFHCKTQLYSTIRSLSERPIVSGANLSDLGEYRPGLDAASNHQVRHPYIEAGIDKSGVRALARHLGLGEVAELPSSPCLSSRVETGIRIEPGSLRLIHAIERLVVREVDVRTARCRIRSDGVVVELDEVSLTELQGAALEGLRQRIEERIVNQPAGSLRVGSATRVRFEIYRNGSAFVHPL